MYEIIRLLPTARTPRVAVIDFDGTLSLIRSGWVEIMADIMLDALRPLQRTTESVEELQALVIEIALSLNGRPTIFQMDRMVDAVIERGGHPEPPEYYTQVFFELLEAKANERIAMLEAGHIDPEELLIPGARAMLTDLHSRGVYLAIASGTKEVDVRREAGFLQIDHFFEDRIFGPGENSRDFAKIKIMRQMLQEAGADGSELLCFGDGPVEIENAKELGAVAIGCATEEKHRSGKVEAWKRTRLIQSGADIIIPDYRDWRFLSELLFPEGN